MGLETIAFLGNVATVAGAVGQGMSAYYAGRTESAILRHNADVSRRQAEATRAAGAAEQLEKRREMRETLARNRAATATAGVQMTGTPLEAELGVIRRYAGDISNIGYNYEIQARQYDTEAILNEEYAKSAKRAGKLGLASALIGGVTDYARMSLTARLNNQEIIVPAKSAGSSGSRRATNTKLYRTH